MVKLVLSVLPATSPVPAITALAPRVTTLAAVIVRLAFSVSVPFTVKKTLPDIAEPIVRLLNVVEALPPITCDAPLKVTVPLPGVNVPPLFVQFVPAIVMLNELVANSPVVSVRLPFTCGLPANVTAALLAMVRLFRTVAVVGNSGPVVIGAVLVYCRSTVVPNVGVAERVPSPLMIVAPFPIVNPLDSVNVPVVSVSVPFTVGAPDAVTPLALLIVRLFRVITLDGIVIPVKLPPKTSEEEAVVFRFAGVPAMAGPFSVSVFAPIENAPLVRVSPLAMVTEPLRFTPFELLMITPPVPPNVAGNSGPVVCNADP